MALNPSLTAALNPTTVRDFQADDAKMDTARQIAAAQLQQQQLASANAQEEMQNRRRAMAVSLLSGIGNEADPAKQAELYATLKPMAERYDTTLKLPDAYDPGLAKALVTSQISPKDQLAQQVELQKVMYARDAQAEAKADQQAAHAAEVADRRNETQARQYSAAIDSNGLTDLLSAVNNTADLLAPYTAPGSDVPGFGRTAGMLPDMLVSQGGKDLRQAYAGVRNSILKARSGGAVTPSESERLLQELGEGTGLPDEQVIKGMANVTKFLKSRISNIQAGYSPEAIDLYKQRGGTVTPDAVKTITAPPQVGSVEDGYVYLGGNPSDPKSWKQAK